MLIRKILLIGSILTSIRSNCQNDSLVSSDSLPEANRIIISYVNLSIGHHIKSGSCFDFVSEALAQVDPRWSERNKPFHKGQYVYGKPIKQRELIPGDIIWYEWSENSRSKKITSHVCIVYSIDAAGNIRVAEQNSDGETLKKTKVVVSALDPSGNEKSSEIRKIRFYRPF